MTKITPNTNTYYKSSLRIRITDPDNEWRKFLLYYDYDIIINGINKYRLFLYLGWLYGCCECVPTIRGTRSNYWKHQRNQIKLLETSEVPDQIIGNMRGTRSNYWKQYRYQIKLLKTLEVPDQIIGNTRGTRSNYWKHQRYQIKLLETSEVPDQIIKTSESTSNNTYIEPLSKCQNC